MHYDIGPWDFRMGVSGIVAQARGRLADDLQRLDDRKLGSLVPHELVVRHAFRDRPRHHARLTHMSNRYAASARGIHHPRRIQNLPCAGYSCDCSRRRPE